MPPKAMTGQDTIIGLMAMEPNGGKDLAARYNTMLLMYVGEFGPDWIIKEINEAKEGLSNSSGPMWARLKQYFLEFDIHLKNGNLKGFIGTRHVSLADFCTYCKGLYFLAAYQLINNINNNNFVNNEKEDVQKTIGPNKGGGKKGK